MLCLKRASLPGLLAIVLAAGQGAWAGEPSPTDEAVAAGRSFDDAVAAEELEQARAGDFEVTSVVATTQNQNAEHSGNTIGGDAAAGSVFVADGAMGEMRGMGQFVVNTGNLGTAQGNMTMTIILNPPPAAP